MHNIWYCCGRKTYRNPWHALLWYYSQVSIILLGIRVCKTRNYASVAIILLSSAILRGCKAISWGWIIIKVIVFEGRVIFFGHTSLWFLCFSPYVLSYPITCTFFSLSSSLALDHVFPNLFSFSKVFTKLPPTMWLMRVNQLPLFDYGFFMARKCSFRLSVLVVSVFLSVNGKGICWCSNQFPVLLFYYLRC